MQCPFCQTENREDRERCYHCDRDISMLRLVTNKARHHYNVGLEHAERGRIDEAIDELHNALDLDRRFTTAHVVLGTLYAKRGEFEKAREAWDEALALKPELARAHQYLQRVETVEKSLPGLKKMRMAALGLLAAVAGLGIALFLMTREPKAASLVREASAALKGHQYGAALDRLDEARAAAEPHSLPQVAASALRSALESELRQEVRRIQELKYREEYPAVLAALAELEARRPDAATSAALVNIRDDVNHYYLSQLHRLFEELEGGRVSYAQFAPKAQEFFEAYPEIPEKKHIAAYLERARELEAERRLAGVRTDFEETNDPEAAVEGLRQIQAELGDTQAAVEGRADAVDLVLSLMFDEFQAMVDTREFAGAQEQLLQIERLSGEFRDVVDVSGPLDLARRVLTDLWTGARLKEAEQLVRAGDPGEAAEALRLLEADAETLTTSARVLVMDLQRELDLRTDQLDLEALRAAGAQLLEGRLEEEETTKTFALARRLAGYLQRPEEKAEALAYAAAAALSADNRELAQEYAARAGKEGPLDSKLAEALEKLLKRTSDNLDRRPEPKVRGASSKKNAPKPEPKILITDSEEEDGQSEPSAEPSASGPDSRSGQERR